MSEYKAAVVRDLDPFLGTVRLYVRRKTPARVEYLCEDGTWATATEGAVIQNAGLPIPAEAIEAIAVAVQEFQGHASHADTEARVLREWLAVEQGRVDRALSGDR